MTPATSTPLVGRSRELSVVEEFVQAVVGGHGRAMLIEGEAGVGKTRLLGEVEQAARDRSLRVVSGAGRELERDLPFAVLAEALHLDPGASDPDRASIGRMLRGELPEGARPGQVRYRLVETILELFERLGEQGSLVLIVDDLHWADRASLAVLDRLVRRIRHAPLGVVASARLYPRSTELEILADTIGTAGGSELTLQPLGIDEAVELASDLVGEESGDEVRAAVTGAGGNPLLITELVAAIGSDAAAADDTRSDVDGVPASIRHVCRKRLRTLPDDTLSVLRVAAVLGSSFDLPSLAGLTQHTTAELAEVLDPALSEGAIVEEEDRLSFRHDLLRDAIYTEIPRAVRESLHADAARWLGEAGYPPGLVATHLLRGSRADEEEALEWLREAAREATIGDPATAVDLLQQALELAGRHHPDRDELRLQLTQTLLWAGRPGEAERQARGLIGDEPGPADGPAARTMLVYSLQAQGRLDDSLAALRDAAALPGIPERQHARAWAMWAHAWAHTGDNPEGEQIARKALELGEHAGDDAAVCLASTALAAMFMFRGERTASIDHGERALAIVRGSSTPEVAWAQPGFVLARALSLSDRHEEAQRIAREGLERAEEDGAARGLPMYYGVLGTSAFRAGNWEMARTELETAVRLADELDYRFGLIFHLSFLTRLAIHRDELESARRRATRAERQRPTVEALNAAFSDHAWGLVRQAEGDTAAAVEHLDGAWERYAPKWAVFNLQLGPRLVAALLELGDDGRAAEVVAGVDELAGRWDTPWAGGQARRCRALADADAGVAREAVELLEQGPAHDLAAGLEEAAGVLGDTNADRDQQIGLLERAQSIWEGLGARRGSRRTAATLRALGVHQGVEGVRDRPDTGWEALTETEWRVAELVAEGLIYRRIGERMFISRRTVETHVSHIFDKLGLSSRAELAAAYLRRHED